MAGIGFVLRKLMRRNDLGSMAAAYFHSMMASSGPWIITIIALGCFFLVSKNLTSNEAYIEFRLIIMFNFSLSLVIASPITNCATRYLADVLYERKLEKAPGLMIGMFFLLFAVALPFALTYYIFFTAMQPIEKYMAVLNFMLISGIWNAAIFISALKYYKAITYTFVIGLLISVVAAIKMATVHSTAGMLFGFNIGLAYILASLIALIFIEYPPTVQDVLKFVSYFRKYWQIALGFLIYAAGLWVDKWIMWTAPEAVTMSNGMHMFPDYDSALFISYLTVIPAMAFFLLSQETTFYESYLRFYRGIQEHDSLDKIKLNHQELIKTILYLGRNLLLIQGFICIATIILAPYLFHVLGINLIEIGMFRIGVLGAAFQILSLFIMVILSYFDDRNDVMYIQIFFFLTNALFTYITLHLGLAYYGYGFFASALLTFLLAAVILERYVAVLPYHTFVTQNILSLERGPDKSF